MICEHEYKVGEKHVLPQDQAFGLTWQSIGNPDSSWGTKERASTDPTTEAPHVVCSSLSVPVGDDVCRHDLNPSIQSISSTTKDN